MSTRLCLVEDDQVLLSGLRETFEREPDFTVAGAYLTAERALRDADWATIQVLIVDIELPGMNGVDLVTRLAVKYPHLQIMVYTIAEDRPTVLSAIKRGATGYLVKGSSSSALVTAVRELLQGGAPMTPKIAREIIRELQPRAEEPAEDSEEEREMLLSDREREILQWISMGHSRAGIARTLNISAGTVHSHIKNIYTKLQAHNRTEAINRARDLGEL